ncbi:hypothetical protein BJX64DRAFT_250234 [Aspergillus heterothallicus]
MAYWEAMSTFLVNQPLGELSYLDKFSQFDSGVPYQPNPWTGICTPLFVCIAKPATLVRQRSSIRNLACDPATSSVRNILDRNLLRHAKAIERSLLSYHPPDPSLISEIADARTPIDHLLQIARIYRLSTLLEPYRRLPELLEGDPTSREPATTPLNLLNMATATA